MNNIKIAKEINSSFETIRNLITVMQNKTDVIIADAEKRFLSDKSMYAKEYLERKLAEDTAKTSAEIVAIKEKCALSVHAEIANIRFLLDSWISMPMNSEISALLRTYSDIGLTPTVRELRALEDRAEGNYLAQRCIAEFGRKIGVDTMFTPVEDFERRLNGLEGDLGVVIRGYAGKMENYSFTADKIGLSITPKIGKDFWVYAEEYMSRDNSTFAELQKDLCSVTESEYTVRPSVQRQLNDLLDGSEGQERIDVAKSLLREGGQLADVLKLYDTQLFKAASTQIIEEAKNGAKIASEIMHQQAIKAMKAKREAETLEKNLA